MCRFQSTHGLQLDYDQLLYKKIRTKRADGNPSKSNFNRDLAFCFQFCIDQSNAQCGLID